MKQDKNSVNTVVVNYHKNMYCKNCGKKIDSSEKFCRHCGGRVSGEEKTDNTSRICPFCKSRINIDDNECPICHRVLVEKISSSSSHQTHEARDYHVRKGQGLFTNLRKFFREKINLRKFFFNRYFLIIVGVIFVVWISSGDDTSYNSGGTKAPLPTPVQQVSDDVVEFTPTTPAVSLANGTIIKKNTAYLYGEGKLYIDNGTGQDTVAKLVRGGSSIFTVYIKANSKYTITSISDGTYFLLFAHGTDWDSTNQIFKRNFSTSRFDETFDFTTTEDYQYIYYPEFEVTLHPVVGGTAETSSVDPAQFNAY